MRTRHTTLATRLSAAALVAAAAALPGCYHEGGIGVSLDQFTYVSTSWSPMTITVRDTRTSQDIWSMDVPVGSQLVLRFDDDASRDSYYPALMYWELQDDDVLYDPLSNKIMVPDMHSRRVDMKERAAPEMAPSNASTVAPAVAPAGEVGQPQNPGAAPAPPAAPSTEPPAPPKESPVWNDPFYK
jgi:hypothetical protein